ncbi:MAG TPA: sulfatase [Planctomycetota bacterium]|nr:sulfatase [Planctomycetota bacterium]HRR82001.1 sulfatase [Planctomycetota bacterium]HRT94453.1 sulfatase [Planctomycetota bacterium]
MPRPNILYIHSHDTGRYVQPYGYPVPTPHIQRLAEQGVVFRQNFCAMPSCSSSRAALLTGMMPHNNGMLGLAHRGWALYDYRTHIVHTLRKAGYRSTLCGVQHVARDASVIGYDEILKPASGKAEGVSAAAAEFLRGRPPQPFFLSVGFNETHRAFREPGPAEDPRWCRPPDPLPDTPATRRDMASFKASARALDAGMGAVFDALDAAGLADNTLVICTTDHGLAFPCMKCNLTDHGTGVMLILRGPGGFAGGRVCDAMVTHLDLFPTVCDLLGIERPAWLQGASLLPLVRGEAEETHDAIFTEVTYHAAYEPMRAVRTRRWKYIRRFDGRATGVMPNCDDSPSKDVWLAAGWRQRPVAAEQLYDLAFDPNEACNLAGEAACAATLDEMRGRLDRWMRETDDPLLRGRVPAPPGAKVNPADGLSPNEPVVPAS